MTFLIGLLTSRIAGPVAGFVAVILLALCLGQCTRAVKAEGKLARAQDAAAASARDLATCQTNTTSLRSAIAAQNAAVADLKAQGAARLAVSDKAARDARAVAESLRRRARDVLAEPAPPLGEDICLAASALILEHVK